jgi:acetyl esterase/lipase
MRGRHQQRPRRLAYGPGPLQFGELRVPNRPGPHPTVILIHGGFWRAQYGYALMNGLAEDLAARGIASWNIEYRRVGDPGGGWPNTLLDVAAAADHLLTLAPRYALDLKRIVAIGHSAGGHLALWLAGRSRLPKDGPLASAAGSLKAEVSERTQLAGVISLAGVNDLALGWRLDLGNNAVGAFLGGSPDEVPERYAAASPAALLPLGVPQVLIRGTADNRVPLRVSQEYAQAARDVGDQVTLIELEEVDHFAVIDAHSAAWARTIEALQDLFTAF